MAVAFPFRITIKQLLRILQKDFPKKFQSNAIDSEDTIYRKDKNSTKNKRRDLECETPPPNDSPLG
jgi:hypothetical protein